MDMKVATIFFLLLCSLPCAFSEEEQSDLECHIATVFLEGAELDCKINQTETDILLTAELLRGITLTDDKAQKNYTIDDYPYPITSFRVDLCGNLTIQENTLKLLPSLVGLHIHGKVGRGWQVTSSVTIAPNEFQHTPDLKNFRLERLSAADTTLQSIRSAPGLEMLILNYADLGTLNAGVLSGMKNLKYIGLEYNNIHTIETGAFDGLLKLETISLYTNNISSLAPGIFKDSKQLKKVDLTSNNMRVIKKGSFKGMSSVSHLILFYNRIESLETASFDDLTNLEILDLSASYFASLPEGFLDKAKNLAYLHLSYARNLTSINSTTFRGLRKLRKLSLDMVGGVTLIEPGSFDDLVNLRWLSMAYNRRLKTLPDGLFTNLKKLESVNLRQTCIENLSPSNFTHCANMQSLTIGENCTIEDPQSKPSAIECKMMVLQEGAELACDVKGKETVLSADELRRIAVYDEKTKRNYTIGEYPYAIVSFDVSIPERNLTIAPNTLKIFPDLLTIYVHGRSMYRRDFFINIAVEEFTHTPELKTLRIERISLSNSTIDAIRSAHSVERLILNFANMNNLTSEMFLEMSNVTYLSLEDNGLTNIESGAFDSLINLKALSLSGNQLNNNQLPPNLFSPLEKLETLDLTENRLNAVPSESLRGCGSLSKLIFAANHVRQLESGSLENLPKLTVLNLDFNQIEYVEGGVFDKTPLLAYLNLKFNDLRNINSTSFRGLKGLLKLSLLSNMHLCRVEEGSFDDLINLRHLSMARTRIWTLPDGLFSSMTKLESVDFKGLCIENLSPSNFTHCPNLQSLKLASCEHGRGMC